MKNNRKYLGVRASDSKWEAKNTFCPSIGACEIGDRCSTANKQHGKLKQQQRLRGAGGERALTFLWVVEIGRRGCNPEWRAKKETDL